jgi:hypothetical protein
MTVVARRTQGRVLGAGASFAALALGLLGSACSRKDPPAPEATAPGPVLFFAVDGMDWDVLLPLVQRGEMPTFAGLMERGAFGELRSLVPTSSPVIWTTIATGKGPRKHGIEHFVYEQVIDGKSELRVYSSGQRRTKAFWNILSDAGISVDVIGWWVTYPAEHVNGLMVSQTNTTAALQEAGEPALLKGSLLPGVEGQVWPREREAEVLATLARVESELPAILAAHFGTPPHPLGELEKTLWAETLWAFRADETYLRILEQRLDAPPSRLTALYMGQPDVVGHRFWRYARPAEFVHPPPQEQIENFGGLLEASYRRADSALASLLPKLPADTTVFVVSDHGMHAGNTEGTFEPDAERGDRLSGRHLDAPPAVLIAAGPRIAPRGLTRQAIDELARPELGILGSVLDVLPTMLVLLEIPLGADMDGAPLAQIVEPKWLAAHPPRSVPTHDTPEWLRAQESFRADSRDLEERLEQLRALGYIR